MNFFKSVFSDDPDPPNSESESEPESATLKTQEQEDPDPESPPPTQSNPNPSGNTAGGGGWMFGDLIKTLATKSESVIETYRRDLQEFGSGLKKEIEVAHGSLETVGHAIDEFGNTVLKGTAQIISQGTDAILAADDQESDSSESQNQSLSSQQSLNSNRYSRFDAQVRAIQGDVSTYCDEPEDLDDYEKWKLGFDLEEKSEEIDGFLEGNGGVKSIYKRVVPSGVDHETFWCRYFYRVYKLRQAEDVRVNLVKRAISVEEDEELSWDVDDEEYDDENASSVAAWKSNAVENAEVGGGDDGEVGEEANVGEVGNVGEEANVESKNGELVANRELGSNDCEVKNVKEENGSVEEAGVVDEKKGNAVVVNDDTESESKMQVEGDSGKKDLPSKFEKEVLEGKNEGVESGKGGDVPVVVSSSTRSSAPEEEDLGWDEIEDLSSIDEKKESHGGSGSPKRAELRKRLSTAEEEEEDLSWDIEDDDDQPAKA